MSIFNLAFCHRTASPAELKSTQKEEAVSVQSWGNSWASNKVRQTIEYKGNVCVICLCLGIQSLGQVFQDEPRRALFLGIKMVILALARELFSSGIIPLVCEAETPDFQCDVSPSPERWS